MSGTDWLIYGGCTLAFLLYAIIDHLITTRRK